MSSLLITLFAYLIDRRFGEFTFIKHPVVFMGELITFFEQKFYKDSILRGVFLVLFVLGIVAFFSFALYFYLQTLPLFLNVLFSAVLAAIFVAHNMLRESVLNIINAPNKKEAISMLVSRDTQDMSSSDINKAAIESYAENLSDGVIAPLFYLLLFNLPGIILYKAINTMDSMVAYRNKRYEKFGKVAAKLDDLANFIPSRLTALILMLLAKKSPILSFYSDGSKHESPNAGHPITAMALALDISLGGPTSYFGKVKNKPYFGKGRKEIQAEDISRALAIF